MTESPPPNLPKFDAHSLILYFGENLAVIKRHWLFFSIAIGIAAVVGGYAFVSLTPSR
jgi:hypothetical protein